MAGEREVLKKTAEAIWTVYRTVGSPGDFGYDTPKGDALKALYDCHNEIELLLAPAKAEA